MRVGTAPCHRCGEDAYLYEYNDRARPVLQTYCRHCGGRTSASTVDLLPSHQPIPCEGCGAPVNHAKKRNKHGAYCEQCKQYRRGHQWLAHTLVWGQCVQCGAPFTTSGASNRKYCSDYCGKKANKGKGRKRRSYNRDDAIRIAYRDGYKCHICHRLIDLSYKAPHPRSLAIDHLVPVSHGGSDDPLNLAAAHYRCNVKRSNTGPAQLRMAEVLDADGRANPRHLRLSPWSGGGPSPHDQDRLEVDHG